MPCCGDAEEEEGKLFQRNGERDVTKGPVKDRSCTDILCLPLFLASVLAFILVNAVGGGSPAKLYKPRDYQGAYCGLQKQWNGGPNLADAKKLTYTMNLSASLDGVMKQMMCSSVVTNALQSISSNNPAAFSTNSLDAYLCACCLKPCASCTRSHQIVDVSAASALESIITARVAELASTAIAENKLFRSDGANGDIFNSIWKDTVKYFLKVCMKECNNLNKARTRTYDYVPAPDDKFYKAWMTLKTDSSVPAEVRTTIESKFKFTALSFDDCPYPARACVPMPGVEMDEGFNDQCHLKVAASLVSSIGKAVSDAMKNKAVADFQQNSKETFGKVAGTLSTGYDVFIITFFIAFVVGFIYMVLLRFVVGWVVWISIWLIFLLVFACGALCYARSNQCAGASFLESGRQDLVNAAEAAKSAAADKIAGGGVSEAMSGNGADYRGVQSKTVSRKTCQNWDSQTPHTHTYLPDKYSSSDVKHNFCRNPEKDMNTIWCFTTDPSTRWEVCRPMLWSEAGLCPSGFAISSETGRTALKVGAYIIWVIAFLYLLLVCCLRSRIKLAIALNKVAARFMMDNVYVLFIPIVQSLSWLAWTLLWIMSALFLLSQVPDDYTPTGAFATYEEAHGTDEKHGECTKNRFSGFAYRDDSYSDCKGLTPKCWRCAPPRYIIDTRFFFSFFHFVWTNCAMVDFGLMAIAGAVVTWFFTPRSLKKEASSVGPGMFLAYRYHLGTVLFGSLLIAICKTVRFILEYLKKQAEAEHNYVMSCIFGALSCFVYCWEKCLKFLNKNAYVQCAMLGTGFCTSAKRAFFFVLRNALRIGILGLLADAVSVVGILLITIGTSALGYMIFRAMHPEDDPILPLICYVVMGYIVSKLYMEVFEVAVLGSLHCFVATEEMGGDSAGADSFVPTQLQDFVDVQEETRPSASSKSSKVTSSSSLTESVMPSARE